MNRTLRNFCLDIILYFLVGANIALVTLSPEAPEGSYPDPGWHLHAILGILMTAGCLVHILWHWRWFQAVLTGKAKGRTKLIMNSMVTMMMSLACLSGHAILTSGAASRFHNLTGTFALIGLSVHAVKHIPWMAAVAKKHVSGGRENASRPA